MPATTALISRSNEKTIGEDEAAGATDFCGGRSAPSIVARRDRARALATCVIPPRPRRIGAADPVTRTIRSVAGGSVKRNDVYLRAALEEPFEDDEPTVCTPRRRPPPAGRRGP